MEFAEVVKARHSYRGFLPKPVDEKTLKDIFELASWAPSNCNVQPWHVHVLSGEALERMRAAIAARAPQTHACCALRACTSPSRGGSAMV